MTLGEKIRELRKANGMSQETLADELDVSRQSVSKWEQGLAHPSARNMARIAGLFHVPATHLEHPDTKVALVMDVGKELSLMKKNAKFFVVIILFLVLFLACFGAALYGRVSGSLEEHTVLALAVAAAGFMLLSFLPVVGLILRYVYQDCRIRGIRPTFWVLISTSLIGLAYYLLKRDMLTHTADR